MGRSRQRAELHTGVVIGTSEATALALGGSELEVIPLAPGATSIEYFGHQGASDAWASASGAIYLCLSRPDPLIVRIGDAWGKVPLPPKVRYYLHRVVGFSGATPADDELYCLGSRYDDDDELQGVLLWRQAGAWREVALPRGKVWELAGGQDRDVVVSVGLDRAALVRVRDGKATKLKLPAALAAQRAVGLCVAPDGAVVACFAPPRKDRSTLWILRGAAWKQAGRQGALEGWATGYVDSVAWNGQTYLATDDGVFVLDAAGKLRRDHAFVATRLWPIGDALVCVGYRNGSYAHGILRDKKWESLMIPEPDIVFGGYGKSVWLPSPRRKVPHKRIRVVATPAKKAPKPKSQTTTALSDYTARPMKSRVFAGARARPKPFALVDGMRDRLATRPAEPLRRFLALFGAQQPKSFGQVTTWSDPGLAAAAASIEQAPAAIATFTNTYLLGTDRGGQCYFVDVAPASSAVWLYGPGVGVMSFLADSLDALLYLCDLDEQWEAYAQTHDLDFEDIERGDVDTKAPEVRAITAGMKTLDGHVDLSEDTEVTSDFHEVLPGLTGQRPTAKSSSVTARLFDRARWLVLLFGGVYCDVTQAVTYDLDHDRADRATGELAATKLYWLWHLWLFDDPRLAAFAASLAKDKASLVRDTAALVLALSRTKPAKALAPLVACRDQVRAARKKPRVSP